MLWMIVMLWLVVVGGVILEESINFELWLGRVLRHLGDAASTVAGWMR